MCLVKLERSYEPYTINMNQLMDLQQGNLHVKTERLLSRSIEQGLDNFALLRQQQQYVPNIGSMVSLSAGGLAGRIAALVDREVASALQSYEGESINSQFRRESSRPRDPFIPDYS